MATYFIGDLQGCDEPLERLLQACDFSPSRDQLVLLGDLINRGPDSLQVLRRLQSLGGAAQAVLGNHDLHALAVWRGHAPQRRLDTLTPLLDAPDAPALMQWLRGQSLALFHDGLLAVHAGVLPAWDVQDCLALAHEVQAVLQSDELDRLLAGMYGNTPDRWDPALQDLPRWRVIINAFTRLRFCSADGQMEFETKESAEHAPAGFAPWFELPTRRTQGVPLAFGHWSTLTQPARDDVFALDSGCVWGGCLSALRWVPGHAPERLSVPCPQAQRPGPASQVHTSRV